jgi:transcription-repair coupling factor (superfamily II helicase)
VDVLIGTHRLPSKDVLSNVWVSSWSTRSSASACSTREHFKKLRSTIDVLTLTATPIPGRTLQHVLSGIRDIAALTIPPRPAGDRDSSWQCEDDEEIRAALWREKQRARGAGVLPAQPRRVHRGTCPVPAATGSRVQLAVGHGYR